MWITKFKNDIRDFIVQEKVVELDEIIVPSIYEVQTDYELSRKYEVTLVHEKDDMTQEEFFYWFEESKQERVSPKFQNKQIAEHWMKSLEQNATVK